MDKDYLFRLQLHDLKNNKVCKKSRNQWVIDFPNYWTKN